MYPEVECSSGTRVPRAKNPNNIHKIKKNQDAEGHVIRKKIKGNRYFYSKLQSMHSIQDIWAQEVSSMTTQFPETVQEVPLAT